MIIFNQSIVRRRAPLAFDSHGNEIRDWSQAVDTPIDGLSVQPNAQTEDDNALRNQVVTSWRVQSPPGVDLDLLASDRVVHDGIVCDVIGEVARWPDPITGAVHHVEAVFERTEG